MKINKPLTCFVFLLILIPIVSANLDIAINVKDNFYSGEEMFFNYNITSDIEQEITFNPYVYCIDNSNALMETKTIHLMPNVSFSERYSAGILNDEEFSSGSCLASVNVMFPEYSSFSKNFTIFLKPSFNFSVDFDKRVFLMGENIVLGYISSIKNLDIVANLTYPDGKIESVNLPLKIKADKIGTYILEVITSKEGYKTVARTEQFGVIESNAVFSNVEAEDMEVITTQNDEITVLEKDSSDVFKSFNLKYVLYIVLGIIVLILIILLVYYLRKEKSLPEN